MSELPTSWSQATLADVVESHSTIDPKREPDKKFRYVDIGSIDNRIQQITTPKEFMGRDAPSRARRTIRSGDVLFSTVRTYLKNIAVVPNELDGELSSTGLALLRPNAAMTTGYLYNWVRSDNFVSTISKSQEGSLYPAVTIKGILDARIMVPPIAEQKRIVEKIDSLTTRTAHARADLDRIQSLALKYKARIIELGCAGDLTSVWRASKSYPKPRRVRLGDVAQSFNYGTSSKSAPEGDVPVLRMGNIQNGRLDWVNLVYTSNSAEIEKYRLENGDVLFNRTNSPELVGKTAVYKGERKAIFAGYLIRVKCGPKLLPDYLSHCLNGPAGRRYSWDVKRDSVSQSNINAKKLANFEFLLPTLDEQSEIVNLIETALSWLDRVSADHAVVTELLPKLDAAILSKAFCGELVPQDPNDVSAHKLLVQTNEEMETLKAEPRYRQKTLSSRKPIRRKTTMTDLIEVLESRKGWISASDTARELGIGDGSTSDEVEKFYGKLRECVLDGSITVERRDDEDWLRLQSTKVA